MYNVEVEEAAKQGEGVHVYKEQNLEVGFGQDEEPLQMDLEGGQGGPGNDKKGDESVLTEAEDHDYFG